jgi:hypothetical protein
MTDFKRKSGAVIAPLSLNILCQLLALDTGFYAIDLSHGVVVRAFHVVTRFEVVNGGNATHPLFAMAFFTTGSERADEGHASDDKEYFFHCF